MKIIKILKNQKGVSLLALTLTFLIMAVIVSVLAYSSKDSITISKYKNLENDIALLRDKVEMYYLKNDRLPILKDSENVNIEYLARYFFKDRQPNDNNVYYVIDLNNIGGITLNYGSDFFNIKSAEDTRTITDVYIVNEQSHHIYYADGVLLDDIRYYTTYFEAKLESAKNILIVPATNDNYNINNRWNADELSEIGRYDYNVEIGDTNKLNSIADGSGNYDLILLDYHVWSVPTIANTLSQKYNLLTIGNDSNNSLNIISTSNNYSSPNVFSYTPTTLGSKYIGVDFGRFSDNQYNVRFVSNTQILYNSVVKDASGSKVDEGNSIGALKVGDKTWVHSQIAMGTSNAKAVVKLMQFAIDNR